MKRMFCFQCEQTANGTGCTSKAGVCGKKAEVANLQDELTEAVIGMAYAADLNPEYVSEYTDDLMTRSLFATVTNVDFYDFSIEQLISEVRNEKCRIMLKGNHAIHVNRKKLEPNIKDLWRDDTEIRSIKSLILFGARGAGAYAHHATVLGYRNKNVTDCIRQAMLAVGYEHDMLKLQNMVTLLGRINLECMELLEKANTETFGIPTPQKVAHTVKKGPFIIVSGHDLRDLAILLEQTEGKGINVYTHGEMLPAHGYPGLNKYPHLKGHYGTAWQNQQKEFASIPAAILFTSNCLMPPKVDYYDRVFTTGPVNYPGLLHIDDKKDFSPVIEKALELGGYDKDLELAGINDGQTMHTGYSYRVLLTLKDRLVDTIKSGQIKHIYLVGGCDGAKPGRNYYTEFVKSCSPDSIILTLGCCKFRFNDLDLGEINGIPRLLDLGQCNDAYGAIVLASELAKAFDCDVNQLPLTIHLTWYEQKAVSVLLTLIYLGIKNIELGPSTPLWYQPKRTHTNT